MKEHVVSDGLNPEPETETVAPGLAVEGLRVIEGMSNVKVAVAESLAGPPVAVIV